MKQIFVIGPSGVGKTTLCKKLSDIERDVVHVSFDDQVNLLLDVHYPLPQQRSGEEGREFWRFCKNVIMNLSQQLTTDTTLLFDVDAGAEYIPECQDYLIERANVLVCLMADPEEIYTREVMRSAGLGNPPQSKEVFLEREFSPAMQKLYGAAAVTVNVDYKDIDSSVEAFKTAVDTLVAQI